MYQMSRVKLFKISSLIGLMALALSGCATTTKLGAAASIARTYASSGTSTGFDWTKVLPPAPVVGGNVGRTDMEVVRGYQILQGSPRWTQATSDAATDPFKAFSAVMGPEFTALQRPEVAALFAYAGRQSALASSEAKAAFPRPRPFLADASIKLCVTEIPGGSSYPSGHAGWGWLSAQILARVEPTRAEAILARGRDYGLSRVICGVHYPSDVDAGRLMGDAVLARLEGDGEYQRLLIAAKGVVK